MQITFIRHLPTAWNKKNKLQGRRDIEISPVTKAFQKGIADNQKHLGKRAPFDLVVASTLIRTQQTANLYGHQAKTDSLLDEMDFGPFEGHSKEQLIKYYGNQWFNHPKQIVLGESISHLEKRLLLFLKQRQHFTNILVFGHGAWIRAMISHHQYGHINNMNKITLKNNECVTLSWYLKNKSILQPVFPEPDPAF